MQVQTVRPRSPHIRPVTGSVVDLNGTGIWSVDGLRERYRALAAEFKVAQPAHLVPPIHREGERTWIYPLIDDFYPLIAAGDVAATEIGVELIEEDAFFRFGSRLKMNMARALRKGTLSLEQKLRLRKRIVSMLLTGNVPLEFREYKRLLRAIGIADFWPILDAQVDRANPYVMRHYIWLDRNARSKAYRMSIRFATDTKTSSA